MHKPSEEPLIKFSRWITTIKIIVVEVASVLSLIYVIWSVFLKELHR
jgi:hypothetical protein